MIGTFIDEKGTTDIEEIKRRIGNNEPNKQVDVKQVDAENVQKIDNFDSCIDASCLSKDITDDKSLLYQVNMQKKTILDIINELNQMKKRLNLPLTQIPDISALQSSMEKPQLNDKRTNLKRRINGNLATVQIETELSDEIEYAQTLRKKVEDKIQLFQEQKMAYEKKLEEQVKKLQDAINKAIQKVEQIIIDEISKVIKIDTSSLNLGF